MIDRLRSRHGMANGRGRRLIVGKIVGDLVDRKLLDRPRNGSWSAGDSGGLIGGVACSKRTQREAEPPAAVMSTPIAPQAHSRGDDFVSSFTFRRSASSRAVRNNTPSDSQLRPQWAAPKDLAQVAWHRRYSRPVVAGPTGVHRWPAGVYVMCSCGCSACACHRRAASGPPTWCCTLVS